MGIGIGGGIGPFWAGVRVSDREIGAFLGWLLLVAAAFAALFVGVLLAPIAGGIAAIWLYSRAKVTWAVLSIAASVAIAALVWPWTYAFLRYGENIPDVAGVTRSVEHATTELNKAGFFDVAVSTEGNRSGDSYCWVSGTEPAARQHVDRRSTVTILETCSPPAS